MLEATGSRTGRPVTFHCSHSAFHLFSSGATASRISMLVPLLPGEEKPLAEQAWRVQASRKGWAVPGVSGSECPSLPTAFPKHITH